MSDVPPEIPSEGRDPAHHSRSTAVGEWTRLHFDQRMLSRFGIDATDEVYDRIVDDIQSLRSKPIKHKTKVKSKVVHQVEVQGKSIWVVYWKSSKWLITALYDEDELAANLREEAYAKQLESEERMLVNDLWTFLASLRQLYGDETMSKAIALYQERPNMKKKDNAVEKPGVKVTITGGDRKWCGKEFTKDNPTHDIPVCQPEDLTPEERAVYDIMIAEAEKHNPGPPE